MNYDQNQIKQFSIEHTILSGLYPPAHVLDTLDPEVSRKLGIPSSVKVVFRGIESICMSVGAGFIKKGKVNTLGFSSGIAGSSRKPIIDNRKGEDKGYLGSAAAV